MTYADAAIRALIRGAGYRVTRSAPLWVSLVILAAAIVFGGR
jgi:hypothetical protein